MEIRSSTGLVGVAVAILVAVMMLGTILVPVIYDATHTTVSITNEGAGELRYAYYEEPAGYLASAVYDSETDTITTIDTNYTAPGDLIFWASDVGAVIFSEGKFTLLYDNEGTMTAVDLGDGYAVHGYSDGTVEMYSDNIADPIEFDEVAWAYVNDEDGVFGFFTDTGKTVKDFPVAAAGAFAGAYAYDELNSLGLSTLAPTYSVSGGVFNIGSWQVAANADNEDENEIEVRFRVGTDYNAVPTPSYTDGDWGFNLSGNKAVIVSYSGSAGSISIPSTVTNGDNTYTVTSLGIGSYGSPIFDNATISGSTLTIPDSVTVINQYAFGYCSGFTGTLTIPDSVTSIGRDAFCGCSGFTGTLTIPDSVTSIGETAFDHCFGFTGSLTIPDSVTSIGDKAFRECTGFTGTLTIPDSVTSIGNYAFDGCSGFTGTLTIPDSVTSIGNYAFDGCSGLTGLVILGSPTFGSSSLTLTNVENVLNLGNTALAAGDYGLPADVVIKDEIPSMGYIAPVSFSTITENEGAAYDIMNLIPVMIVLAVLMMTVTVVIRRD